MSEDIIRMLLFGTGTFFSGMSVGYAWRHYIVGYKEVRS